MSDTAEELIKNIFDLGEYSFAQIEFGEWEKDGDAYTYWTVYLHLLSSGMKVSVGTCYLEGVSLEEANDPNTIVDYKGKQVEFYVEMDDLMEMISKEVSNKTGAFVLKEFGATINPELNVQIYGKDYT